MKILVVDDEALARARLIRMLGQIPGAVVVGEADRASVALTRIAELTPDLVLLDVEMPGVNGLALAQRPHLPPIVFTTAHTEFAAAAFACDAVDYLVKPVRHERLVQAIERVRRRALAPPPVPAHQIAVHGAGSVRFVDARHITAFRALDKYTEFTFEGEQLLVRESLSVLAERLSDLEFVRVHRAALVKRDAIIEVTSDNGSLSARLTDGSTVEVSYRQAAELRRRLGLRQ